MQKGAPTPFWLPDTVKHPLYKILGYATVLVVIKLSAECLIILCTELMKKFNRVLVCSNECGMGGTAMQPI